MIPVGSVKRLVSGAVQYADVLTVKQHEARAVHDVLAHAAFSPFAHNNSKYFCSETKLSKLYAIDNLTRLPRKAVRTLRCNRDLVACRSQLFQILCIKKFLIIMAKHRPAMQTRPSPHQLISMQRPSFAEKTECSVFLACEEMRNCETQHGTTMIKSLSLLHHDTELKSLQLLTLSKD